MHTWTSIEKTILGICPTYLGVEGVELQLVRALERLRVDLLERDPVELALEDVDLFHVVIGAPDIVALSG